MPTPSAPTRHRRTPPASRRLLALRAMLMASVAACLIGGLIGGLLRAGVSLSALAGVRWAASATAWHAALMICGFFGTVIGIERAVALRERWAFATPLLALAGGLHLLLGSGQLSPALFVAAALAFVAVNVAVVRKQAAPHTVLLLVAASVWLIGTLQFWLRGLSDSVLAAWFAYLVLTIAAERLEMSRLMRHQPHAQQLLVAIVSLLGVDVLLAALRPAPEAAAYGVVFGLGLCALALWLGRFDIARRTVRAQGLSRYMAVCLLGGYAWLAAAGLCWAGQALGMPTRDAALHALGLGFIFSMVMGHAPVILPAVAGVKVHFDRRFYLPLALLHASLLLRLLPGHIDADWHARGAALNAIAIAIFALTMISAAWSWRRRHGPHARLRRTAVTGPT